MSAPPGIQCNVCLDEYTEENGAFRLQCMLVTSLPVLAKSQTMSAMSAFLFTLYEKLKTLKNDTVFIVAGATAFVPLSHLERGSPALHPLLGDGFSGEGCGEKRHLFFSLSFPYENATILSRQARDFQDPCGMLKRKDLFGKRDIIAVALVARRGYNRRCPPRRGR